MIASTQALLQSWSPPVAVNASLCLAMLIYARGWIRLHATFPKLISAWRLAAYLAGVAGIWLAIGSPLEAFDDVSLTAHMVQHLLLMSFSPPLILLGWPALPLLRGLPQGVGRFVIGPISRSTFIKWLAGAVTNPLVCWLAAAFALIGWHLPGMFEAALQPGLVARVGTRVIPDGHRPIFWWPVVQLWPSKPTDGRDGPFPCTLFCATLPCDLLSAFLAFCDRVVYQSYLSGPMMFGVSALQDQECAAALMWVSVTLVLLIPAVVVTMEILSPTKAHRAGEPQTRSREVRDQYLPISKLEVL